MKLDNIKTALVNLLFQMEEVKMGKITTDKGVLGYEGEELVVDGKVVLVTEDNTETPVEDGDYVTEDETTITIKDGKVVSIVEKETEEEPEKPEEKPVEDEKPEEMDEEKPEEKPQETEPENEEEKPNEVDELKNMIGDLVERIDNLEKVIEELKGKPADKPAEEQFEVIKKKADIPNKGKERAFRMMQLAKEQL